MPQRHARQNTPTKVLNHPTKEMRAAEGQGAAACRQQAAGQPRRARGQEEGPVRFGKRRRTSRTAAKRAVSPSLGPARRKTNGCPRGARLHFRKEAGQAVAPLPRPIADGRHPRLNRKDVRGFHIYVEKKPGFDVEGQQLAHELRAPGHHLLEVAPGEPLRRGGHLAGAVSIRCIAHRCSPRPQVDVASARSCPRPMARRCSPWVPARPVRPARGLGKPVHPADPSQGERPEVRSAEVCTCCPARCLIRTSRPSSITSSTPSKAREATLEQRDTLAMAQPGPSRSEVLEGLSTLTPRAWCGSCRRPRAGYGRGRPGVLPAVLRSEGRCPPSPRSR